MSFDFSTLVTDRTQADVEARNDKGTYQAADLNRVTAAMEELVARFSVLGYLTDYQTGPETPTKPQEDQAAWSQEDVPTTAQMERYLTNVEAVRRVIAVLPTTPATPESMELLDYIRANEIEQILADVDDLLKNMAAAWYYSGEVYCGEV